MAVKTRISFLAKNIKRLYVNDNYLIININSIFAIAGNIFIIVGCFMPAIHIPLIGNVIYIKIGKYYGEVLILFSIISIILAMLYLNRYIIISAVLSISVFIYSCYSIYIKLKYIEQIIIDRLGPDFNTDQLYIFYNNLKSMIKIKYGVIIILLGFTITLIFSLLKQYNRRIYFNK